MAPWDRGTFIPTPSPEGAEDLIAGVDFSRLQPVTGLEFGSSCLAHQPLRFGSMGMDGMGTRKEELILISKSSSSFLASRPHILCSIHSVLLSRGPPLPGLSTAEEEVEIGRKHSFIQYIFTEPRAWNTGDL